MAAISAPFHGQKTEMHITPGISGIISASTLIAEVDDLSALDMSRAMVDLLSYQDDNVRKLAGAKDNGAITLTLNWTPDDADHTSLSTAFEAATLDTYAIRWVSGANFARADFSAYVSGYQVNHPKDDKVTAVIELTISGAVTFDFTGI